MLYTRVIAQWFVRLPCNRKVMGSSPDRVIPKLLKWYSLPSHLAVDVSEWSEEVKHAELPVGQSPAVPFTAFTDLWPRATGNGDMRCPMCHCQGRNSDLFDLLYHDWGILCLLIPPAKGPNTEPTLFQD